MPEPWVHKFWVSIHSVHSKILCWCLIRCLVTPTGLDIRRNQIGGGHQAGHNCQQAHELAMTAVAPGLVCNSGSESCQEIGLLAYLHFSIHSSVWTQGYTVIVLVRATFVRHRHSQSRKKQNPWRCVAFGSLSGFPLTDVVPGSHPLPETTHGEEWPRWRNGPFFDWQVSKLPTAQVSKMQKAEYLQTYKGGNW